MTRTRRTKRWPLGLLFALAVAVGLLPATLRPALAGTAYKITTSVENGSVVAKVGDAEVTEAEAGQTVTLTVAPNPGYEFETISATTPLSLNDLVTAVGDQEFIHYAYGTTPNGYPIKVVDGSLVHVQYGNNAARDLTYNSTDEKYHLKFGQFDNDYYIALDNNNYITTFYCENGKTYDENYVETGTIYDDYSGQSQNALPSTDVTLGGTGTTRTFTMPARDVEVNATFKALSHTHDLTYAVSGATITAICGADGCWLENNQATLTIAAPEDLVCDERTGAAAKAATVTSDIPGITVPSIAYTKDGNAVDAAAVKAPGTYVASVTLENVKTGESATGNVTASVEFTITNDPVAVTLDASNDHGQASLMDASYQVADGSLTMRAGERFVLRVSHDDGYDYSMSFNPSVGYLGDYITAFTSSEVEDYVAYAEEHGISMSAKTDLFWVTMPGTGGNALSIAVDFAPVRDFTILYRPTDPNASEVWCKFAMTVSGKSSLFAGRLKRGATMADGTAVWSLKMAGASDPTQVAFASSEDALAQFDAKSMTAVSVKTSANENDWTPAGGKVGSGSFVVIGGNARTVMAAFVNEDKSNPSVSYRLAVVTGEGGSITPGSVTAPAAPVKAGYTFEGWRGYEGATEKLCAANGQTNIATNVIFVSAWRPNDPKVTLNRNRGTGGSDSASVTFGELLRIAENPTREGFVFDGWTVRRSTTQSGAFFEAGSPFDLETPLTADLELQARWKHVHDYVAYQLGDPIFGGGLDDYLGYAGSLHAIVCACGEAHMEAHSFDAAGTCACGYRRPTPTATLKVSYGRWDGTNYTPRMGEPDRTVTRDQEVSVYAPDSLGAAMEFSKWQYSTDGTTWKDLSAYLNLSFIIPCDMQVRALYVNPVANPQVSLSAATHAVRDEASGRYFDTISYHMDYKLPEGCTYVDSGVKAADNEGVSYYELKEVKQSAASKWASLGVSMVMGSLTGDNMLNVGMQNLMYDAITGDDGSQFYYQKRENSALDEKDAATLGDLMYRGKPVNAEKYPPLYWECRPSTKSQIGSANALVPVRFAQMNNQDHWIYAIGWLRYQDRDGKTKTIHTEALPATLNSMPGNVVTKTAE